MRRKIRIFYIYMDIYPLTNDAIMRQIGLKLKELRIGKNMKQKELSNASGVSLFTISAVENGKTSSMLTIIQILRALEHLDYLGRFFEEQAISPIAYSRLLQNNKKRERVKSSAKVITNNESEW